MSSAVVGSSSSSDARLLRERPGEHGALPLAAAQRPERAVGEARAGRAARAPARPPRRSRRLSRASVPRCGVRPSSTYSRDGHPRRHRRAPGGRTRPPRDLARGAVARSARRRARSSRRGGRARRSRAAASSSRLRSGRSASPTRPASTSTRRRDDGAPAEPDRHARRREIAFTRGLRLVRRTIAKNGAPKNAVTTPIGSSAGDSTVRAMTSAKTRKPAADEQRQRQQHRGSSCPRRAGSRAGR